MESSPMPQVTYTSVFGFSNSMCTHSFLGSSRIAYVDSKLQPFTTIRHNECKLPNPAANVRHTATRFMPWQATIKATKSMWWQNKPTKPYQLSISTACWKAQRLYALLHAQCFKETQGKDCWNQWEKGHTSELRIFRRSCRKMSHKLARNTLQSHSHTFFGSTR